MPRSRQEIPTYRKITSGRAAGRAAVTVYRADGARTNVILPGAFGSPESKAEYEAILAQLRANDGHLLTGQHGKHDITIAELVLKFMSHAQAYYVDPIDKTPTSEIATLKAAVRPLVRLFGSEAAAQFGPVALQTLQDALVSGSWLSADDRAKRIKEGRPIGMARSTVNKNVNRIKQVFKWGASQELISASVSHALATVAGLRRGRSGARETEPVKPISSAVIDDTLLHLPPRRERHGADPVAHWHALQGTLHHACVRPRHER